MVVAPGDWIRLEFVNNLDEPTNIHFHGFHTSPSGIADNVLRTIAAHSTAKVAVPVPRNMSPGVYWYHSHEHTLSEEQVFSGLSGAIVVQGVEVGCRPSSVASSSASSPSRTCRSRTERS